jgi:HSP20 family protein
MPVNPWRDLRAWQERLERLAAHRSDSWAPPIDVYETADSFVVSAEVPGLTREQIELAMADSRLVIRGARIDRAAEGVHYQQVERGHGAFSRTFEFDAQIDADRVTADLANGVLTVTLPKKPAAPGRKIDVR